MSAEPLHVTLWKQNRVLAEECLAHPFIHGLGEGNLETEVFKRYVAQDAFFLRAFLSAGVGAWLRTENGSPLP